MEPTKIHFFEVQFNENIKRLNDIADEVNEVIQFYNTTFSQLPPLANVQEVTSLIQDPRAFLVKAMVNQQPGVLIGGIEIQTERLISMANMPEGFEQLEALTESVPPALAQAAQATLDFPYARKMMNKSNHLYYDTPATEALKKVELEARKDDDKSRRHAFNLNAGGAVVNLPLYYQLEGNKMKIYPNKLVSIQRRWEVWTQQPDVFNKLKIILDAFDGSPTTKDVQTFVSFIEYYLYNEEKEKIGIALGRLASK